MQENDTHVVSPVQQSGGAHRTYHLLVAAFFVCLLLSFSVFYLTEDRFGTEESLSDACYDGSVITGQGPIAGFLRVVYCNKSTIERVRTYEYRLFGIINNSNVVAGRESFLFELKNEETDYDYLKDYIGQSAFTEEEHREILAELERRRRYYGRRGAEYLLVILPNAQSVYPEYMPSYLGGISEQTRTSRLCSFLDSAEFSDYIDLTEALRAAKSDGSLYNNTENSLNARGVYYAYRAVYDRFSDAVHASTTPIPRESLSFLEHHTTGKAIAKRAGLEHTVLNNTVSLANNSKMNYIYMLNTGGATQTELRPAVAEGQRNSILLQFSDNWEKLQSEPFFSNTFYKVTYQTGLTEDPAVFAKAEPSVVIQFLYEDELSLLLEE